MLKGKTALVTGSTSGIGLGIARALAGQGCQVMIHGLGDPAVINAEREAMTEEFSVPVFHDGSDISTAEGCSALVSAAEQALGGVDILVNNAGIQHVSPTESFPPEKWDSILAINLTSYFHTTRLLLPGMKQRGWGRIINTASVHGLVASINKVAYVAAKHGVVGMTKVIALENAEGGITCNAICPGWVNTPLVQAQIEARAQALGVPNEEGAKDLLGEKQPSKRFASPEDIGALAVFLCSPAAQNITGTALPVDGGWTAQ
ncbi:3-hydroxybutyrate dehydrogenase [Insolitispirillum peregrinum]|uniref:3-hydroxybutyrate dehydrogenase n=1 Tax=Insolitispirillum peregrinum TaxID=80876 RepID=A0A1N7IYI8_9PROT|nr:3-hydroxybutyrate dehydrogenase [Insolitispirillum peregrinum]SIS42178.1 3-hydroxybutyrate dehydrogenase [Insolitispirillum peregrinum]